MAESGKDPLGTDPMIAEYSQKTPKKFWSPNSPFGQTCVFPAREALSFVHRRAAELKLFADAMAALTENLEPKRWRAQWLADKFAQMGMPRRLVTDGMVLMFLPDFVASVRRQAMEESMVVMEDTSFDAMVDMQRGGNGRRGMAFWTGRPTHISKIPGAPVFKMRQMQIRFKP